MKMSLKSALELIYHHVKPKQNTKLVPISKASRRFIANNFYASFSLPLKNISLRDGYALKKDDTTQSFLHVKELKKVSTGSYLKQKYIGIVENEKVKNQIIKQKDIQNSLNQNFIKPKGEDIKKGELLIQKGKIINAFDIANLASQGVSEIEVLKRVKIGYLCIGDELVDVAQKDQKALVYNSNGYALSARGESFGAKTTTIVVTKNNPKKVKKALLDFKNCDAIVTIGGMSKNDAIEKLDGFLKPVFRGVALAPAGLSGLSFLNKTPLLHLPGLPMSAMLGFEILCTPLIYRLYGLKPDHSQGILTQTLQDIRFKNNSQSVRPGFFNGKYFKPIKVQAGMMNILNRCNGYILPDCNIKKGQDVIFYPFLSWNNSSF